ncbi:MAG TPA: DUF302 domain-containing protein [Terriglobales bacterium]|nr:DUF302 domain-containing protein [Terriglobales bacterium]
MAAVTVPLDSVQGLESIESRHSVDETLAQLELILKEKGITVFSVVDHSGEAAKVGMEMHPTKLVLFGSPRGGTPLMIAASSVAIDLPLKALIWEDNAGRVWISYNTPEYLQQRHNIPSDLIQNIAGATNLLKVAAQ